MALERYFLLLPAMLILGCGGDNDSDSSFTSDIKGRWVSNCSELKDSETKELIAYTIDSYEFSDDSFTQRSVSYEDNTCSGESIAVDEWYGTYTIGTNVVAADGLTAQIIMLDITSDDWPESHPNVEIEYVYRVTGDQLSFGFYSDGVAPELIVSIVYTKFI